MLAFLWLVANVVMIIFIIKTLIAKDTDKKKRNRMVWLISLGAAVVLFFIIGITGSKSKEQDGDAKQAEENTQVQTTEVATTEESEPIAKETEKTGDPTPTVEEVREPEEFEVFIESTAAFDGDAVVFDITTNLPDEAKLMITLSSGDYNTDNSFTAQTYVTVANGKATSDGFLNKGHKLSGDFDLDISMGQPSTQTEAVKASVGEKGELMIGPLVKKNDITSVNYISAIFNVSIGDDIIITAAENYNNTIFRVEDESEEIDLSALEEFSTADKKVQEVNNIVQEYIDDNYTFTSIDRIDVNPDLGTDAEGDYIALVYLIWDQKNSGKTSKEVLDMYSQDMAVRLYDDLPEIQELCVFWTVPYLNNGSAKISFERANGSMKITDKVFDKNFN